MIVKSCWNILSDKFTAVKMNKDNFSTYMKDLNAGRTDADHYDAEDISNAPKQWEIDDITLQAFSAAYARLESFFQICGLI